MRRHSIGARPGWREAVESQGLIWHTDGDIPYWDERGYYEFSLAEIETIEAATEEVYRLFLAAGERIVGDENLLTHFGIPSFCHAAIAEAWHSDAPSLDYGRFDFGYDGRGEPKLFEFNCDTPTSLLEAAVVQWNWKEDVFPRRDQFNSLHEKLIARWDALRPRLVGERVWFTHIADDSHEDTITTTYLRELAETAGIETHAVIVDDIGLDADGRVVDRDDNLIAAIYKLYPWEWIVAEPYGPDIVAHLPTTAWIEPIWKMMWSNKAVLHVLWDMFPGHPNLLRAATTPHGLGQSYVAKPFLAREGANVSVVEQGRTVALSRGHYGGPTLYQELFPLKDFGNGYPVLGSWIVGGEAAGMGVREDALITGNRARFVPHVIVD